MHPWPRATRLLVRVLVPLLLLTTWLGCAGPSRLAGQSRRELAAGNVLKAYELARRAVDKDAESGPARSALRDAAAQLVSGMSSRVVTLAPTDTLAAARQALELRDLRLELDRYSVPLDRDSSFDAVERRIRDAAAGIEYRLGARGLEAGRPKEAYRHFREAASFVATFQDVERRMAEAREQALTRVAVLPFVNDTDLPGLSRALADHVYRRVAPKVADLEFTELVHPDEIYASMTVRELESPRIETALRVAHGIEADRVVLGRVHGFRVRNDTWSFQYPIYRRTTARDSAGRIVERYVERRFEGLARERAVSVRWDLELLDTRTRTALVTREAPVEMSARVAWTDFQADGDCDDYVLAPPALKKSDPEACGRIEARWAECFGSWSLADLLEEARDRRRSLYESRYREEFRSNTRQRPVFLGELPSESDLAHLALEDLWRPVADALREVDARD